MQDRARPMDEVPGLAWFGENRGDCTIRTATSPSRHGGLLLLVDNPLFKNVAKQVL